MNGSIPRWTGAKLAVAMAMAVAMASALVSTHASADEYESQGGDSLEDVNHALTDAQAVPHFDGDGQFQGYKKLDPNAAAEYQALQLRNIDTVTAPDSSESSDSSAY